jgi:hypothetical protein
MRKIV